MVKHRPRHQLLLIGAGVVLAGCAARSTSPPREAQAAPPLLTLRGEEIARAKVRLARGDTTLRPAFEQLLRDADAALAAGPFSVMDKRRVPPSGDRHDYMSLGPYWWPDSTRADGLPYVRRDGRRNPEAQDDYDSPRFKRMTDAVGALALAYYFTGREPYAERAALLVRTWFLDPATRMNPNLEYAQAIPGVSGGRGIGIIDTRELPRLLDGVALLERSPAWTAGDRAAFRAWATQFLDWLLGSANGRDELAARNNHGSWYDAQTAGLALFLGRRALAREIVESARARRIAVQIRPDGRQPLEEVRTRSFDYSVFNLEALMQLAELGRTLGVDLWEYETPEGAGIRRALDHLAPYADTTRKWAGAQITAVSPTRLLLALRLGELVYRDPHYRALVAQMPPALTRSHRLQLLYPPPEAGGAVAAGARPGPGRLTRAEVAAIERERVLAAARRYLREAPITVTAVRAVRSAGGPHDYYSEGDYWWPNPLSPDSPYVRRDGETNPDNFVAHRDAMRRLSLIVPALAAAYEITGDERYARQAAAHLDAWFVAESTRMSPHLLYGQAIKGVATGRGTGIIDTIHLVEVARAVSVLERSGAIHTATLAGTKAWFRDYLGWMTTHAYGIDERNASNNHSAAWALQVAEFARLVGDSARRDSTRRFFKETLIPGQMAADGSFPRELGRTKPYGYSLFQLDVMAMVAESLSRPDDDLWTFTTADGRGMRRALEFMSPYIRDRKRWPRPPDVMYGDQWPIRHPALFFGARALGEPAYLELWRTLPADPTVEEVIRNYPVRQPLLWLPLPDPSRPDRS